MSKLMNATFTFDDLKRKYKTFSEPKISVKINNKNIKKDREFVINELKIELTCGYEANIASFDIYGVIDDSANAFKEGANKNFNLGSRIDISVGYDEDLEEVFTGFICGVTYNLPQKGAGNLIVECMDVKGIMMNNINFTQHNFKKYSDCIQNIFGKSQYSSYYNNVIIDNSNEETKLVEITDESDYDFLVRIAKKINYEFFISQSTVYFRKKRSQNTNMANIKFGYGLEGIDINYNILGMVNSVEVRNTDNKTGELIQSKVISSEKYSNTSSASKILKSANKIIIDSTVYSQTQATERAKAKLDEYNWKFGLAHFHHIGTPEIIPGRFITLKKVIEDVDKKFYITKVIHNISKQKFITNIEARLSGL